jgi:hypothetical protein
MYRGFVSDTGTHLEFCPIGTAAYGAVIRAALPCTNQLHLLPVLKEAWNYSCSSVAQQPNCCLRLLAVDVRRSYIIRHPHTHTPHTHTPHTHTPHTHTHTHHNTHTPQHTHTRTPHTTDTSHTHTSHTHTHTHTHTPHTYTHNAHITHTHTHTSHTHTHTVRLLCKSDHLVAQAATYTTHYKHNRRMSVPSAGLEKKARS